MAPRVVVGVSDSGINPYHEQFYRPGLLTEHPSHYVEDFPEDLDIQRLDLSLSEVHAGELTRQEAIDQDGWDDLETNQWYWIPDTPFVGVYCLPEDQRGSLNGGGSDTCILDSGTSHGTGVTSAIIHENPDTLIAFKQGGSGVTPLETSNIPIDLYSISWGTAVPIPLPQGVPDQPLYVKAAGNDPRTIHLDGWSAHPDVIAVSGAYPNSVTGSGGDEAMDARDADVVAWYCRDDLASANSDSSERQACGTSFSAPTVAGALSKAILEIRLETGYTGSIDGADIDPVAGVTKGDLRSAMNQTATYDPTYFQNRGISSFAVPTVPAAPWLQWGWGWYDGVNAEDTAAHLLDDEVEFQKDIAAQTYMDISYEIRKALYGW